jgi:hypothetical protein
MLTLQGHHIATLFINHMKTMDRDNLQAIQNKEHTSIAIEALDLYNHYFRNRGYIENYQQSDFMHIANIIKHTLRPYLDDLDRTYNN